MEKEYKKSCNWCEEDFITYNYRYRLCKKCREKYNKNKELRANRNINYKILVRITQDVPRGLDKKKIKEKVEKNIKNKIINKYNGKCGLCNRRGEIVHHIVPCGSAREKNLILLCSECHSIIHEILYVDNKWKKTARFRHW